MPGKLIIFGMRWIYSGDKQDGPRRPFSSNRFWIISTNLL